MGDHFRPGVRVRYFLRGCRFESLLPLPELQVQIAAHLNRDTVQPFLDLLFSVFSLPAQSSQRKNTENNSRQQDEYQEDSYESVTRPMEETMPSRTAHRENSRSALF